MSSWPDIIVAKPDSPEPLLAIEVKLGAASTDAAEAQLKEYMIRQSCPSGMVVTPDSALFFRNWYTSYEPDTIQLIGHCRTAELLGETPLKSVSESTLVLLVEQWLESLGTNGYHSWPPAAREAIESCVLPAVFEGTVRATGSRSRPQSLLKNAPRFRGDQLGLRLFRPGASQSS